MQSFCKSLLFLVLSACCVSLYPSCTGQQKKQKIRTPVVCSDTSKHHFALDTLKGYELKPYVKLSLLLNIESFNSKEEFDKYFMRPRFPTDSTPPSLNFKNNWLVGILIDNKTQRITREWVALNTQLWIDSAFTKNCQLTIPFYLTANEARGYEPTTERRFLLFSIPRSEQFNKVFVMNMGGTLSRGLEVPAAEE